ncbi:LOW QUALITY PROTEIN: BOS complex subunit TMEM147 [Passerculus sandwichensis]
MSGFGEGLNRTNGKPSDDVTPNPAEPPPLFPNKGIDHAHTQIRQQRRFYCQGAGPGWAGPAWAGPRGVVQVGVANVGVVRVGVVDDGVGVAADGQAQAGPVALLLPLRRLPPATTSMDQYGPEFLRATVDVADLGGLQLALGRGGGRGELRILVAALGWASAELLTARWEIWDFGGILVAALGWASAELLTARCVPLWVGARGVEFDWRHLQMGLDSNISLVRHVAAAALLWVGRHDLPSPLRLPLGGLLAAAAYEGFLIGWAGQALGLGPWGALGLRALGAAALGLGAMRLLVPLLPPP